MEVYSYKDVTDNLLYDELCLAFSYSKRIRKYIDLRRKYIRIFNIAIIIISSISAFSYFTSPGLGAILSFITAFSLVLKQLLPILNQPEIELAKLHECAHYFASYFVKIEKMFVALKYKNIHPEFFQDEFFVLKEETAKWLTITNEYYRGLYYFILLGWRVGEEKLENEINIELKNYLKRIYGIHEETEQ